MESTIRFTGLDSYQCKQLNHVSTGIKSIVEYDANNDVTGLAVKDEALFDMDIGDLPKHENFTLIISSLSFLDEKNTGMASKKVSGYLEFGFAHSISGFVFTIDPDSAPRTLVIAKSGNNVTVTFDTTVVATKKNMIGPLRFLHLMNNQSDATYYKFVLNDISYSS
jgi:hypothetical protein